MMNEDSEDQDSSMTEGDHSELESEETTSSGNHLSRRTVVAIMGSLGLATVGAVGYTSDPDDDGIKTGEELQIGLDPLNTHSGSGVMPDWLRVKYDLPINRAYTENETKSLKRIDYFETAKYTKRGNSDYYEGFYPVGLNYTEHSTFSSGVDPWKEFVHDQRLHPEFVDLQLQYWLEIPPKWQRGILKYDPADYATNSDLAPTGFHLNDWAKSGEPQVKPKTGGDGWSNGSGYRTFIPVNPDRDAFLPNWYNHNGMVHNPITEEYFGFQPEKGDKVGKEGDKRGKGRITDYLRGNVAPKDLTGNRITVTWMDTYGGAAQVKGAFEILDEFFHKKPPGETSIDFFGINGALREDTETPPRSASNGHEMVATFESNVPDVAKGPVNYLVLVEEGTEGASGTALDTGLSPGGWGSYVGRGAFEAAYITLHELYWHGVTKKPHPGERPEDTIASYPPRPQTPEELDFLDKEWRRIMRNMNAVNRDYYQSLRSDDRIADESENGTAP